MNATFTISATYSPTGRVFEIEVGQFDGFDAVESQLRIDAEDAIREVWEGEHEDDPDIGSLEWDLDENFEISDFEFEVTSVDDDFYEDFVGFDAGEDDSFWEFLSYDDDDALLVILYCNALGLVFDSDTLAEARDRDYGYYDDEAAFTEEYVNQTGAINLEDAGWIVIDWEATFYQGLQWDFEFTERPDGNLHFFRSNS